MDDRILLMWDVVDTNKEDYDEIMKKIREVLASLIEKLIENVDHIFHQNQISSPDNDVDDDGILEITKSTSETKPSKSDPSSFWNPT